ncbi:hypothetical protein TRICI_006280 [Trichomonascus ciferrii]|uniref:F-box domain-containing protein n=1 Tax=Trichomonascus ciferrii TaxID=44093 RepID=A0A642UJ15_9ASCO|nr:hypothetical protein TRICI_006280 [Trichomonascus ciferrii]
MKLSALPAEILLEIFENGLNLWTLLSCRLVCRRFKSIVDSSDLRALRTYLEVQWSFEEHEEPENGDPSCSIMLSSVSENDGLFVETGINDIKGQASNGLGFLLSFLRKITFYTINDDYDMNASEPNFESMHVELAAQIILELIRNREVVINRPGLQVALPAFNISFPNTRYWISYINDFPESVEFYAIFLIYRPEEGAAFTLGRGFKDLLFELTSTVSPFQIFKLKDPRFVSLRKFGGGHLISSRTIQLDDDDIKMIGSWKSLEELRLNNVSISSPYWASILPDSLQALSFDNVYLPEPTETTPRALEIQRLFVFNTVGTKLCNLIFPTVKTLTLGASSCMTCKPILESIWPTLTKLGVSISDWNQTDIFLSPGFDKSLIKSLTIFKSRDQNDVHIKRLNPILQLRQLEHLSINSVRISLNGESKRALMIHLDDFAKLIIKQCPTLSSFHVTVPNFPPIHLYTERIKYYRTQSSPLYDPRRMVLDEFFREINDIS